MFSKTCLMFCLGMVASIVSLSSAVSYYVSPTGSDGAAGSQSAPFATISKARDAVKALGTLTEDANVYLQGGTYFLTSPITFDATNSGSGGHKIIYQAAQGETPVISGGLKITGTWALADAAKNIYSINVGTSVDTRQLYVNGVRATRARSANGNGWSVIATGTRTARSFTCPASASLWGNLQNVEVAARSSWCFGRSKLSSISGTTAAGSSVQDQSQYGQGVIVDWVENAYELLDIEGEWHLNRATGVLYYKPRTGESITTAEIIMARLETLISGSNVSNIQFKGITFSHATWLYPNTNGHNQTQADAYNGYSGPMIPGNISFDNSTYIRFENDIFTHLGSTAFKFVTACHHSAISGCQFRDVSGSAIAIGQLSGSSTANTYDTVINNLIRDCAVEYKGSVGILLGFSENTILTHNEIRKMPYSGISMGWGWSNSTTATRNNEVSFNRIDSVLQVCQDGAGIYTLSNQPGTKIFNNYISVKASPYMGGIYPDEGSSHMHFYNNVVTDAKYWYAIWTSSITYDTLDYNYYANADAMAGGTNCVVQNNTLVTNGNWPAAATAIMNSAGILRDSATIIKSVKVSPSTATINPGTTRQFSATMMDQFGGTLPTQPTFTWTVSGGGTINSSGLFTAGNVVGGPFTVTATSGSLSATATVSISLSAKLLGTAIGTSGSYSNSGNTIDKAFDDDVKTFFDAPDPGSDDWVGLDLGSGKSAAITSIRYFPRATWEGRMNGGVFQGSNVADFSSGVVELYTIPSTPPSEWSEVSVDNASAFRYIRYLAPAGQNYGNVAEIEFYGSLSTSTSFDNARLSLNKMPLFRMTRTGVVFSGAEAFTFSLFDTQGKLVRSFNGNDGSHLDLSSIKTGMYIAKFQVGKQVSTETWIKNASR